MKNNKYYTVTTIPQSNIKLAERGKINTLYTQIHDLPLCWLLTGTSIKMTG
jgi:hypothetical protein